MLDEVFVDGLATLQNRASVFETLNLFENKASGVDFVLNCPIYGYDAFFRIFLGLSIREDFDLGPSRPFDDVLDHVAL